MKTGNLFHSAGPANAKARFPNFLIDRVTTKLAGDEYSRIYMLHNAAVVRPIAFIFIRFLLGLYTYLI